MNNLIRFLEKMWLIVAIVCLVMAIYKSLFIGFEEGMFFFMFATLATVLWLLRRRMRRRMDGQQANSNSTEG